MKLLRNLLREESGQDLIEYALAAAMIALAAVAAMSALATARPLRKQTLPNARRAGAQAGRSDRHGKVPR